MSVHGDQCYAHSSCHINNNYTSPPPFARQFVAHMIHAEHKLAELGKARVNDLETVEELLIRQHAVTVRIERLHQLRDLMWRERAIQQLVNGRKRLLKLICRHSARVVHVKHAERGAQVDAVLV